MGRLQVPSSDNMRKKKKTKSNAFKNKKIKSLGRKEGYCCRSKNVTTKEQHSNFNSKPKPPQEQKGGPLERSARATISPFDFTATTVSLPFSLPPPLLDFVSTHVYGCCRRGRPNYVYGCCRGGRPNDVYERCRRRRPNPNPSQLRYMNVVEEGGAYKAPHIFLSLSLSLRLDFMYS